MGVAVKVLDRKRPDYLPGIWRSYRLLCEGGWQMEAARGEFIRKHPSESVAWYEERLQRFSYKNIAGTIAGNMAASVYQTPLQMQLPKEEQDGDRPTPEDWYGDFLKDPQGDGDGTFSDLTKAGLQGALQCGEAWFLVALPQGTEPYASRYEQEALGDLDVRVTLLQPETVIHCGADRDGLSWVMLRYETRPLRPLEDSAAQRRITWVYIDRKQVRTFTLDLEDGKQPGENDAATELPIFTHKLATANGGQGAVPIVRMKLRPELWMLDKIASVAKTECRKRNELDWLESVACIPQLVYRGDDEFGAPPADGEQKNRKRGVQHAFNVGKDEDLLWLEIAGAGLAHVDGRLDKLEADIYKTVSEMAMAQGGDSAAVLARSGASKVRDAVAKVILCMAYATVARDTAVQVMDLVSAARGADLHWEAAGCDSHDVVDLESTATWFALAQAIPTKSQTFKRELEKRYIRGMLQGADASVLDRIEKEVNEAQYPDPDELHMADRGLQLGPDGSVQPAPAPAGENA